MEIGADAQTECVQIVGALLQSTHGFQLLSVCVCACVCASGRVRVHVRAGHTVGWVRVRHQIFHGVLRSQAL